MCIHGTSDAIPANRIVHELCMYSAISGVGYDKLLHVYQDNGIGRYR